jgi:hypothetical protein
MYPSNQAEEDKMRQRREALANRSASVPESWLDPFERKRRRAMDPNKSKSMTPLEKQDALNYINKSYARF